MIKTSNNDKKLVVELLTRFFEVYQSINYIIQKDNKKLGRIRAMMEYSIRVCSLFGTVWLSDDKKAYVLMLYMRLKKITFRSISLDLKLIFKTIGPSGIIKTMKQEDLIKAKPPNERMAYLWVIEVDPKYQKFGLGKRLLEEYP